jgi:NitT/TauT family transport system substrate-binding protein
MAICLKNFTIAMLILLCFSSQAQELLKVAVAIPAVTPAATTFVVARDRGYYREEGLDVQLIVMPSATGTQALIGGNVKFSTVGGAGLLPILRGAPLRFLFATFNRPMFWLYSKSDIRSVKDLKGKKWAYRVSAAGQTLCSESMSNARRGP